MSLKHVILSVLSTRNLTGYEITKEFDRVVGFVWKAPHQNVYRDLTKLEKAGFVEFNTVKQSGKPHKKIYSITDAGRGELRFWFATPTEIAPLRDPLLVKFYAGEIVGREILLDQLLKARDAHQEKLDLYLHIEREHYSIPPSKMSAFLRLMHMTLRLGIMREMAWLKWSIEAEKTVKQI